MPASALVHEIVQTLIGFGWADDDFAKLLELQARASGLELQSEGAEVSDGLEPQE
jgi:3-hydroxyisobutyrate dehydrogenase